MLKSRFCYAGPTPLASTIVITQGRPLELIIGPGSFTTTGQAEIIARTPATMEILTKRVTDGWAEGLPGGVFFRHWLPDGRGRPAKSRTVILGEDLHWQLEPDEEYPIEAKVEVVVSEAGDCDLWLAQKKLDGVEEYDLPAGWHTEHILVFPFIIPPKLPDLAMIDIEYLVVLPGSPPSTQPSIQIGRA
jgi:hypothetical protein